MRRFIINKRSLIAICALWALGVEAHQLTVQSSACGTPISYEIDDGASVTLIASADAGSEFVRWSDGNTSNPRTEIITSDASFTAVFQAVGGGELPQKYTATVYAGDCGNPIIGEFDAGTQLSVLANPLPGYKFKRWTDDNTSNPRVVTITSDITLHAEFEPYPSSSLFTVNVQADGCTNTLTGRYPAGTELHLVAQLTSGTGCDVFTKWADGPTSPTRTVTVTEDATYMAEFGKIQYAVHFNNYDGTELQNTNVDCGTMPEYTGETPTKPADAQYTYTFSGWDAELVAVKGEATYTAQFMSTSNKYAITFVNYDGSELQNSEVAYGETPVYTGAIPTKPADAQYTYSFSGWDAELVAVTGEATYTAQFTSTLNKYAITFLNYDGSELQSSEVVYGETPVYTGTTPTKPADAQYTYTFSGWDAELIAVTGEATYTAQFTSTLNKYAITFVNYDGSELQSSEVAYGETPVYTGAIPTKPADAQYTYSFSGWDAELVAVTGEATYTAQFTSTLNKYAITFLNYDGSELQSSEVEAGTMPQYNGTEPIKPADAQYTYVFAGWDKEVVAVTGDAIYTAVFVSVFQCGTIETTDGITVWEDQLPYTWEGISFTTAGTETKTLQASDGCDSIVTFTLRVLYRNITLQENEAADYYTQFAQDYNGQRVNTATLNRQFTQGRWATLCLPFNVNKAMMMSLGLYNRVFAFRYAQQLDDETIQVFFVPAQSIEAGKGYIVNPNAKLAAKTSFVFPNVTINTASDNGDITALTGYNDGTGRGNLFLVGTLRTGILQGSTAGNTYLGLKDNQLYYPNSTSGTPMRAYRAVFRSGTPVNASRLRIIADGETVSELQVVGTAPSDWSDKSDPSYTPARKYIDNGILYIERNGITYTAQGQRLD